MSFKAGDKVKCVRGDPTATLKVGCTYTVQKVGSDGYVRLQRPGPSGGWDADRFDLVDDQIKEDPVNHPPHYTSHPSGVECIEITEWLGFNLGNAFKYLFRRNEKGDLKENLEKAVWYLEREKARPGGQLYTTPAGQAETIREKCTRVVGHEHTFIGEAMSYIVEAVFDLDTPKVDIVDKALSYVRAEIRRVCK